MTGLAMTMYGLELGAVLCWVIGDRTAVGR